MSLLSQPHFHSEAAAIARLEAIVWPDGPHCPRCGGFDRITAVKGGRAGLRRCGPCKREFTVTVGTIFERSHIKLHKWFQAAHLMASSKKGISAHQLHRTLKVTYKTAWFMEHRLREAMRELHPDSQLGGEDTTIIDYGDEFPKLEITPVVAREAAANVRSVLTPPDKPYTELGSIEGTARSIDRDGWGRLVLYVHSRLSGEEVKCFVTGQAADDLGEHQIREVWRGRRLQVYGTLHFKGMGKLQQVDAIGIRFLRDRSDLPGVDDIFDPDFTGGLRSDEYLGMAQNQKKKSKRSDAIADDKEQSKLFIKKASEIGADAESALRADELIGKLAKKLPEPRKKSTQQ